MVLGGEEHRRENSSDAGAGGDVEVIGDSGVRVAGFLLESVLQIGQGLAGENASHAATVDGEYAYLATLVLDGGDAVDGGGVGMRLSFRFGINGCRDLLGEPELLLFVAEEKLAFENGEDFIAELICVNAWFLHFHLIRIHCHPSKFQIFQENNKKIALQIQS